MSNFFTIADSNLECGLQEYKNIMNHVDVTELIYSDSEFYDIKSHPVINDPMKSEEFDIEVDNPQFVVYKEHETGNNTGNNKYHIYLERTDNDFTGWIYLQDQDGNETGNEKLGSVPNIYMNENYVPFSDFELIKKGKIKDIEKDNPEKVFDLIKENVIL